MRTAEITEFGAKVRRRSRARRTSFRRVALYVALLGSILVSCAEESNLLVVDVQTDLLPGNEFSSVRTSTSTGAIEVVTVTSSDDFSGARRVANFAGVPLGLVDVRAELLDAAGATVLSRDLSLRLSGTTATRLVLARSCVGVSCGASQTCAGGQCVSRECSPLNPDACGAAACGRDDNCEASIPCTSAVCADGACLSVPRDDRCPAGFFCDPTVGCRAPVQLSDGGVPDGQVPDAAVAEPCPGMGRNLYVDAEFGDDLLTGLTPFEPFATLSRALVAALPGDCVNLAAGEYRDDAVTRRDATASEPILVRGPAEAILHGEPEGSSLVMRVRHDHVHLEGFTIDGLDGDPETMDSYHRVLLEVRSEQPNDGVEGFVARGMTLRNALRHCVAFRYFTADAEWDSVTVDGCGIDEVRFGGTPSGQGIIIGTSPSALNTNPTSEPDASTGSNIHDSTFLNLNVCVVTREASDGTRLVDNSCTGKRNTSTAGFDLRSNANLLEGNEIFENDGAGIRMGGATASDGTMNTVRNNTIRDNAVGGIRFQVQPQAEICGNMMSGNQGGDATGVFGSLFDPTAACP